MNTDPRNQINVADLRYAHTDRRIGRRTSLVVLLVSALVLLACTSPTTNSSESVDVVAQAESESGVACYRTMADGDLTAVFLIEGDEAWARTIPADGRGDDLVWAEGRRLDDRTWLMYLRRGSTLGIVPAIWFRTGDTLTVSDEETLERVDCDDMPSPAVNEGTGSDPVDLQLAEPSPLLSTERHCYDQAGSDHPADNLVDLTVASDGGVSATLASATEADSGQATGWFATDDTMVLQAARTVDGTTTPTWELWRISADQSTVTLLPYGLVHPAVDCK